MIHPASTPHARARAVVPCRCQADLDSLLPPLKLAKLKLSNQARPLTPLQHVKMREILDRVGT